jgi:hypothetical protein|tara:strand:- start:132 stop:617 length:486 start_codon:yes stop_codon:yes gene_type:complete
MEEDNMSTVAKNYWVSISKTVNLGFYNDYITNPDKRLTSLSELDSNFWQPYNSAYKYMRDSGKLIIRAKVVNSDSVEIYQIYETKQDRLEFLSMFDPAVFHKDAKIKVIETEYEITELEKDQLIEKIISSENVLLQWVKENHRKPGMEIGDPLKNDKIILV